MQLTSALGSPKMLIKPRKRWQKGGDEGFIEQCRDYCNANRPHLMLDYLTPFGYVCECESHSTT
jgi:hypothetical protein